MIRHRQFICLAILLTLSTTASADVIGKVVQVSKDKSKVLIQMSPAELVDSSSDLQIGSGCDVKIAKVKEDKAIASTKGCKTRSWITVGSTVETKTPPKAEVKIEDSELEAATPTHRMSAAPVRTYRPRRALGGFILTPALSTHSIDLKVTAGSDFSYSGKTTTDSQALGVRFGYLSLNEQSIGFLARGTIASKVTGWEEFKYSFARADINATFGNESIFGFGGLNVLKFFASQGAEIYNPNIGFQVGAGLRVSSQSFVEIQYSQSKLSQSMLGVTADLSFNSLEAGWGYNF